MKRIASRNKAGDEMRSEYRFDYRKARRNRFAGRSGKDVLAVVLDPDVAKVFKTAESVNRLLRSVIHEVGNGDGKNGENAPGRESRKGPALKRIKIRSNRKMRARPHGT